MSGAEAFQEAIRAAGLEPPDCIEPGRMMRFPGHGKGSGNRSGWCRLFPDLAGGVFGDWSTGFSEAWQAGAPESPADRKRWLAEIEKAKREAERARHEAQSKARERAERIWQRARPAPADFPYLVRKGVMPHVARLHKNRLLIPVRDSAGALHSLQFIRPDGSKRFLPNGAKAGHYCSIGRPRGSVIVAEGFATAASIHEATGAAVAVAFDAGNLERVAHAIRAKLPDCRLVIAADDDRSTPGNPGLTKAREAAEAAGAEVIAPGQPGDFNDLLQSAGPEAVARCFAMNDGASPALTRSLADIEALPLRWHWPNVIAAGKVTMLAGDPGLGKSLITADITARTTAGAAWPDGSGKAPAGSVIFASAEDDPADTIRPRLEAASADVRRVRLLSKVLDVDGGGDPVERFFNLKRDIPKLAAELERLSDCRLVVIDPVSAYLGGTDSHKNAEVRELLSPLADLASRYRVAILAVTHLNKGHGGNAIHRFSGSLGFVAAARGAWVVTKDQSDDARRLMVPAKNNLAPDDAGAFAYRILARPGALGDVPVVEWEPGRVDISAGDALEDDEERTAVDEAADFLIALLRDGVTDAKEIFKHARSNGFPEKTLRRAKKALHVTSERDGFAGKWRWRLPSESDQAEGHDAPEP